MKLKDAISKSDNRMDNLKKQVNDVSSSVVEILNKITDADSDSLESSSPEPSRKIQLEVGQAKCFL